MSLGATVIDVTDFKFDNPTNHGKYVQLAGFAPQLLLVLAKGNGKTRTVGFSEQSVAMSVILALLLAISGGLIKIVASQ
jgi:hypothetical protein